MNNQTAHLLIRAAFDQRGILYKLIDHEPTRTSEDSARARARGGAPHAKGAKALIVKCEFKKAADIYATLVVPSHLRIDGRLVRSSVGIKKFRFLTTEEMRDIVQLSPGCMPPFGPTIFPAVGALFVDPQIAAYDEVGFNAAKLETSLIVRCADYLSVAQPTGLVPLTHGDLSQKGQGDV
jgi:Ala-tRNA(Pro) deacylase